MMISTSQPKREKARWGILDLGSLAKHSRSYNHRHVVTVLYLVLS